jgi:cell division protein FtsQ
MSRTRKPAASQTVRRGKAARAPARRPQRGPSLSQRALAAQPLSPATIRRIAVTLFACVIVTGAWVAASVTGVTAYARDEAVAAVGRAGFAVKRIEINGANRLDRLQVYDKALAQQDRSMAAFSLAEVREDLLRYGWVADARVSRRLPDTLVIDLVERAPVAVLQERGRYTLIDDRGVRLPGVDPASVPGLPVLVAPDPRAQMPALLALLDAAPALKPQVVGAAWVGNRRWDISFRSGEKLALPQDRARAHAAFAEFARMDGVNRLLGRGVTRFDMRFEDRLVFRPGRDGDLGDVGLISGSDRAIVPVGTPVPPARTVAQSSGA